MLLARFCILLFNILILLGIKYFFGFEVAVIAGLAYIITDTFIIDQILANLFTDSE